MCTGKLWTEEEVSLLRRFYGKCPIHVLAADLRRSVRAVATKASRMGLLAGKRFKQNV